MGNRRIGLRTEQTENKNEFKKCELIQRKGEVLGGNWIPGQVCVWKSAAPQQRKTTGEQDFLGRDAAERWGNTRITWSKQSFHPNVREVAWQAATADNWVQWVCSSPGMWGSFLSASFAPYLHYLISEIMRSQAIKHFDTCWQTASHNGPALLSMWTHNSELSCSSLGDASHLQPQWDPTSMEKYLPKGFRCLGKLYLTENQCELHKAASEMGILPSSLYTVVDLTPPNL